MSDELRERVQQLQQQAAQAAARGDAAEAQRVADTLTALDDHALAAADPAVTRTLLDAATSLAGAGDLPRAERLLRKGIQALAENARATQVDLIVPLNNLLAVYDQAGAAAQWAQVAAAIGAIAERLDGPLPDNATSALIQLGRIYERNGNYVVSLTMYRPVHAWMTARQDVAPDVLLSWLLAYIRALIAGGRPQDGLAVGRQALDVAERASEMDPVERLEAFAIVAATASQQQDTAMAQDALEHGAAVAEALQASDTGGHQPKLAAVAGVVYHNLASLYLRQRQPERYARAEALMRRALALVLEQGLAGSAEHAGALGQLAVIIEARGDLDEADRVYTESIEVYERASDTSAAEFPDFATDLGLMRLQRGQPWGAVGPLRRAVELREASSETAPRRAIAASNLATAYFEAGDLAEATREYTRALDLRFAASA